MNFNFVLNADSYWDQISVLVEESEAEFIPPLSSRKSTTQVVFKGAESKGEGIKSYLEALKKQSFIVALDGERVAGFLSYIINPSFCEEKNIPLPCCYVSTVIVKKEYRKNGIASRMYEKLFSLYPENNIATRTWDDRNPGAAVNGHSLLLTGKYSFTESCRIRDERGQNIDTVYYCRRNPG